MSALDPRHTRVDDDNPDIAHDLIILRARRVIFHDHYASRRQRLLTAHRLVTTTDELTHQLGAEAMREIGALAITHPAGSANARRADEVMDLLAAICWRRGLHFYITDTHRPAATVRPDALFTVVTDYGGGNVVTEHFTDRDARRRSLIERAAQFSASQDHIPGLVLIDDERLAEMISTLLTPTTIHLTESTFREDTGVYAPVGPMLPVR